MAMLNIALDQSWKKHVSVSMILWEMIVKCASHYSIIIHGCQLMPAMQMNVKNASAITMDCPVSTTILWVMAFVLVVNTILKGNTARSAYQSTTGIWMYQ